MKEAERGFTLGLTNGYASKSRPEKVERQGFRGKATRFSIGTRLQYRDEWFTGERTGGGQELVQSGDEKATRLYAGGTIDDEKLAKLGITSDEVTGYLRAKILELGDKTRLDRDCNPKGEGGWKYSYRVLDRNEELDLTIGLETISFRRKQVFAHAFILSPID